VTVYEQLLKLKREKGAGFLVLLDPDKMDGGALAGFAARAELGGADALLVGGSLMLHDTFDELVRQIKAAVHIPLLIFPGSTKQISRHADAILFLSLVSGRNPVYLIGEQVIAAPLIKQLRLEAIPTAYMLIDSWRVTSAEFMSGTLPIPRDKPDIAKAHALAAEYLGMKLVYLEAGSGARQPVPDEMVQAVVDYISIPVVVGGGIRTPEEARKRVQAGASFVVIGNVLEPKTNSHLIGEFAAAIHFA